MGLLGVVERRRTAELRTIGQHVPPRCTDRSRVVLVLPVVVLHVSFDVDGTKGRASFEADD